MARFFALRDSASSDPGLMSNSGFPLATSGSGRSNSAARRDSGTPRFVNWGTSDLTFGHRLSFAQAKSEFRFKFDVLPHL